MKRLLVRMMALITSLLLLSSAAAAYVGYGDKAGNDIRIPASGEFTYTVQSAAQ